MILTGTSLPSSVIPGQASVVDKALHFGIYLLFGVLLSREFSEVTTRWRAAALAIGVAVLFGAADEWHQQFIPGRSTELADWYADSVGATIGALTGAALRRRRTSPPAVAG